MKLRVGCVVVGFLSFVLSLAAQTSGSSPASAQVPPLIQFSNVATDEGGNSLSGVVGITFSLYAGEQGGAPLWAETQNNVQLDATGHYSVQLGITKPAGVPTTLFTSGEARWLGVQIAQQPELPRVLLLSVPYALKAGDAATIGGLPPSAFVLAAPPSGVATTYITDAVTGQTSSPETATDVTTTGGTANYLPVFNGTSTIIDSVVFQSATSPFKIGINTATPASTLDVKGTGTIRGQLSILGTLSLPATANATATAGKNSEPLNLAASAFNSTSSTAVNQTFEWLAEPASNDTPAPSGTLNLLFGEGATKPSETGLHIASNGQIKFANGQTFPGTGDGTITGVTAGTGLSGGGTSGSVSLSLASNACTSGNALTALPFTCSPFATLGANTFTGNQTVNGNLSATGPVSGSSFQIGSSLFAFGSYLNGNAFLGFAGNSTMTGTLNTASGTGVLFVNTTGSGNTASGANALGQNTTGSNNTAVGEFALVFNSLGSNNTAAGYFAGDSVGSQPIVGNNNTALGYESAFGSQPLTNATVIGANAEVTASNAMVLGSINGINGATADTLVGIGTTAPSAKLNVRGAESTTNGNGATVEISNSASGGGNFYLRTGATGTATPPGGFTIGNDNLYILSMNNGGQIGIDTNTITNVLTIKQGKGQAIADGWATYSSRRWKANIQPLQDALGKVGRMRGVSYDRKDSGRHEIGVIAEEVGAVVPEVVTYEENGKDARGVDYSRLTALLIEATKEQQREIRHEHAELAKALRQIKQQQSLLRAQSAAMRSLQAEVHESGETLRKVKAQVAGAQPTLVAGK
jgi:hypothetical protein